MTHSRHSKYRPLHRQVSRLFSVDNSARINAGAGRCNYRDVATNQIGRQCRQSVISAFCPAILDRRVLTLDVSRFLQALAERHRRRARCAPMQTSACSWGAARCLSETGYVEGRNVVIEYRSAHCTIGSKWLEALKHVAPAVSAHCRQQDAG